MHVLCDDGQATVPLWATDGKSKGSASGATPGSRAHMQPLLAPAGSGDDSILEDQRLGRRLCVIKDLAKLPPQGSWGLGSFSKTHSLLPP